MNGGALFDRPYGDWAVLVYERAPEYAAKLKQIKKEMDPQGILNPGKLCF
jgi:FAD/FMN-containing dehydrogenase